ncbi:MAG: hypothetical protein KAT90_00520 [Gammaproteobacteria bacterium]|nr:hypothetical protein [Gammaproteobacteria bacterium]
MIKRKYFYQLDTAVNGSKFYFGIRERRSWKAKPYDVLMEIINGVADEVGIDARFVKVTAFNRI